MKILLSARKNAVNYITALECLGAECAVYDGTNEQEEWDGLLLCGGGDVHPRYYGQENGGSVNIDEQRDVWELALIEQFVSVGKPILGICRGAQILNVYFGGTLCQHLPSAKEHTAAEDLRHSVRATSGLFSYLYGEEFTVNSSHHQAIDVVGQDLKVELWAEDVPEGFVHQSLPIVGVQWHPERMTGTFYRGDTVEGDLILKHFIRMCQRSRNDEQIAVDE